MKPLLYLFVCLTASISFLWALTPEFIDDSPTYSRRVYALAPTQFEPRLLSGIFESERRDRIRRNLVHFLFYRKRADELHFYLMDVGRASEIGPRPTKEYLYPTLKRAPLYLADVISIGGDTVLEARDPKHGIVRTVIAGKDPLRWVVKGEVAEIIHIGYRPIPKFLANAPAVRFVPVVFVRTSATLDPAWGCELYRQLSARLRTQFILAVRNDAWFLDYEEFPVFWAYGEPGEMPTANAYLKTQGMSCTADKGVEQCKLSSVDVRLDLLLPPPPPLSRPEHGP